jgi:hypothetical protein
MRNATAFPIIFFLALFFRSTAIVGGILVVKPIVTSALVRLRSLRMDVLTVPQTSALLGLRGFLASVL